MAKVIVNLTMPVVVEELESVLDEFSNPFYQQTFLMSELHQELVAYVLSRIRSCYVAIDEDSQSSAMSVSLPVSLEERLKIQDLLCQGMQHILSTTQKQMAVTNSGNRWETNTADLFSMRLTG
ncbi:MAG: hypothetical protein HC866_08755 [Leptolyngbyaceae cyanobacterium RU_5_1]|nr:hypothetical protein [Leptolyngbyaceae cyanobacterium RU_5_1]